MACFFEAIYVGTSTISLSMKSCNEPISLAGRDSMISLHNRSHTRCAAQPPGTLVGGALSYKYTPTGSLSLAKLQVRYIPGINCKAPLLSVSAKVQCAYATMLRQPANCTDSRLQQDVEQDHPKIQTTIADWLISK